MSCLVECCYKPIFGELTGNRPEVRRKLEINRIQYAFVGKKFRKNLIELLKRCSYGRRREITQNDLTSTQTFR